MRIPLRIDPAPVDESMLQALTEAVETSGPGVPEGLPPDDLQTLDHVEQPRTEPKYDRFMKNERHVREDREIDPETGWRVETWDIGMNRNMDAEKKRKLRVFIDPIPHVVLDQNVPLRGWYKNKVEPANVRPRPCLLPDAKVDTPWGPREIQSLQVGDIVLGYDEESKKFAQTYVQGVSKQVKDEYLEIELENGNVLRLTPDHLVLTKNRGWVPAESLSEADDILGLGIQFNGGGRKRTLSGVYALVNERDGKAYVGSARDIISRTKKHLRYLAAGRHCNPHLQASYALGGRFRAVLLEECPVERLVEREQHYIDQSCSWHKENGYTGRPRQSGGQFARPEEVTA